MRSCQFYLISTFYIIYVFLEKVEKHISLLKTVLFISDVDLNAFRNILINDV